MKTSADHSDITRRDAMKGGIGTASLLALGTGAAVPVAISAAAVAVTTETAQANVTQPATGITMPRDYARTIAQMAYVWGWPIVNMINRRASITQAPQPGLINGILPVAPRGQVAMLHDYVAPAETFVTCPNQDVVYGLGFFSLDEEPVVAQVPDFGNRFCVYAMYDARTDQFGQLGKPYDTKPGFYLLVGPNWRGLKPAGITNIVRCSTELASAIPRIFQDDTAEDRKAIQPVINQVVFYPLKVTTYGPDAFIATEDYALSNRTAKPNADGSVTFRFNAPGKPNNMTMVKGWNMTLRSIARQVSSRSRSASTISGKTTSRSCR